MFYNLSGVVSRDPRVQGTAARKGKFNLVRVGLPERIHPDLLKFSLDEQAKKLLAEGEVAITVLLGNADRYLSNCRD